MDDLSLELLTRIAQLVGLEDLGCWVLTAKRYNSSLSGELYARGLRIDRQRGWPYHLLRATLLDHDSNAFRALLAGTDIQDINKTNINVINNLPKKYKKKKQLLIPQEPDHRTKVVLFRTSLLHIACQLCSEAIIRLILKRGRCPSVVDTWGWTPLHLVARSGRVMAIHLLVDAGADVDAKIGGEWEEHFNSDPNRITSRCFKETPLHRAIREGRLSALEVLLAAGADPKAEHETFSDALGLAAAHGNIEILQCLLKTGYEKASLTNALSWAATGEDVEPVKLLLQFDVELHKAFGSAVRWCRFDTVKLLIDSCQDPRRDLYIENGLNAVYDVESMQKILALAPGLSAVPCQGLRGYSLLQQHYDWFYECYSNQRDDGKSDEVEEMVMLLIDDGCEIPEPKHMDDDEDGGLLTWNRNIFDDAAYWGNLRVASVILERKKSLLNYRHRSGRTPILYAASSASSNKYEMLKLLVENGADVHTRSDDDETLLERLYSDEEGDIQDNELLIEQTAAITQLLVDSGIDVNAVSFQVAPLIHALNNHFDLAALALINAGANVRVKSWDQKSPLEVAKIKNCPESRKRLLEIGEEGGFLVDGDFI